MRAVKTRDMSILTEPKDQAIYKAAVAVIDSVITEDMTDVEKEKAVHDYLCINMDYDIPAVDDESKADPDADNPYGMLVGHYGICSGYASTFKLFMDCFDIECIIVEGKANGLEEDHAWNKIHIDGNGTTWMLPGTIRFTMMNREMWSQKAGMRIISSLTARTMFLRLLSIIGTTISTRSQTTEHKNIRIKCNLQIINKHKFTVNDR